MDRKAFLVCGVAMTLLAAGVRLNNAISSSVLGGYDAFAHFTYIWFLATTGRVPLADSGWEFFQPPLYYAAMAAVWNGFDGLPGAARLHVGTALMAMLGLAQGAVAFVFVRRRFPDERLVQLLAAGLMFFIPVHLYSSGFVGNEGLAAALSALSLLLLLPVLERPSASRAAALGLVLGLAMLTKFTAVVVVAAAFAAVGLKGLVHRDLRGAARTLGIVALVLLAVSGWYYARNILVYGEPFRLSRDQLFLARVEDSQLQGRRTLLEYVLFDPGILYRPQWPRGLSLDGPRPPGVEYSAMRESIPTGLYANTWFDGFGGFVLPPVTASEASRRAGQVLLTLGTVPTAVMLLGFLAALASLKRREWDDGTVVALLSLAAMAAVIVQGTRTVPTQAAVKATYLTTVSVAFAYLFALGLHALGQRSTMMLRAAAAACALLFAVSALVFTHDLVIDDEWTRPGREHPLSRSLFGVIDYAAGDEERARAHFEASALGGWHVGYENLAAIALERDNPEAAAWFLLTAAQIQPSQCRGTRAQRERAISVTQAEYANSMAVIFHRLGRLEDASGAVRTSIRLDPAIPESWYDLGVLELLRALGLDGSPGRTAAGVEPDVRRAGVEQAAAAFAKSAELDPAFLEARAMRGVSLALLGECEAALPLLAGPVASPAGTRAYPVETGPGDLNAAGLHRRRRIESLPRELGVEAAVELCRRS